MLCAAAVTPPPPDTTPPPPEPDCGDLIVQPEAGEECEPPSEGNCDADCQIGVLPSVLASVSVPYRHPSSGALSRATCLPCSDCRGTHTPCVSRGLAVEICVSTDTLSRQN